MQPDMQAQVEQAEEPSIYLCTSLGDISDSVHNSVLDGEDLADREHMAEMVHRFRMQTRFIVKALRRWRVRHEEIPAQLPRRFSAYEGMLCREDLQQHWKLYRQAMKEYRRIAA